MIIVTTLRLTYALLWACSSLAASLKVQLMCFGNHVLKKEIKHIGYLPRDASIRGRHECLNKNGEYFIGICQINYVTYIECGALAQAGRPLLAAGWQRRAAEAACPAVAARSPAAAARRGCVSRCAILIT